MGFLDFLFPKTQKMDNDFFGEMTYVRSAFICCRNFKPTGKAIDMGVSGKIGDDFAKQKTFFKQIEDNYAEITQSIIPVIEDEFRNWMEDFRIADFSKEFFPVHLFLPLCDQRPVVWKISFETIHDEYNHNFEVTMHDRIAIELHIDG